jgi:hypothetical protein
MENAENKGKDREIGPVPFWGGENDDKQDYSMDWDHEGHFWIGLTTDQVDTVVSLIRQILVEKVGGEWSQRPSSKASGRYLEEYRNHYLFADFTRKGYKERFVEIHPVETGKTIFVRFWGGLLQDVKTALERQGFQYSSAMPEEYQLKVPGMELSAERKAILDKFRQSQPLAVPEGKLEATRVKSNTWIGILFVVIVLGVTAFLLRDELGQLFIKEEPLNLGKILAVRSNMAAFETPDGSLVYALAPDDIESKIKPQNLIYGGLIDTTKSNYYAIKRIEGSGGLVLYQAPPEAIFSIPDVLTGEELAEYQFVDASSFRYDRKRDWEKFRDQKVKLQGDLLGEEDGFYLQAGDGYIKIGTANTFALINLQIALLKGQPVTLYGTVSATYDWQEVRKESKKMFRFNIVPVSYATLTAT